MNRNHDDSFAPSDRNQMDSWDWYQNSSAQNFSEWNQMDSLNWNQMIDLFEMNQNNDDSFESLDWN